ncbi:MAG: cob(I)yrinic acid a,c-diamide adenosyltransferase [Saprospiraceae bacterium]
MAIKIYTKTGDDGTTGLFGGGRLPKDHLRIEAYGTVDELNAQLGWAMDLLGSEKFMNHLETVQYELFVIGSMLATKPGKEIGIKVIDESSVEQLERWMDELDEQLPPLKNFILPGGHPAISACHLARCICRRAERRVVSLSHADQVDHLIIRYLNRLSDYLFILSRAVAQQLNVAERVWKPR